MKTEPRTFKIKSPHMKGEDVASWQREVRHEFERMDIQCPIKSDGVYGLTTRSYTASLCHALGMHAAEVMAEGVTPELRIRIRNRRLTPEEHRRYDSEPYQDYRRRLRTRWNDTTPRVHRPVAHILADSWGYHPPVHDGIDVLCAENAILFAMVRCQVIDVRSSGWWGKGAPSDTRLASKGDGIIQVEVLDGVGPFVKGQHIGYGHAEKAQVRVGEVLDAGEPIGRAGLANAWHIHLMLNDGKVGQRGVGNLNPRACLDYAKKYG